MIFDVNEHLEELKQLLIKELPTSLPEEQISKYLDNIKEKAQADEERINHLQEQLRIQRDINIKTKEMLDNRNQQLAAFKSIIEKVTSPYPIDKNTPLS